MESDPGAAASGSFHIIGWIGMKAFRRILLWVGLVGIILLAVLSVIGAFLGSARAGELFNSVPLAVLWGLLAILLAAGFLVGLKRVIKRPAPAIMHLACAMIICGAMWGSRAGHCLQAQLFGGQKVAEGYMFVRRGVAEQTVRNSEGTKVIGQLPFALKLKEFTIEYYPPDDPKWRLYCLIQPPGRGGEALTERIPWQLGKELNVPYTDVRIKVLQCLESPPAHRGCPFQLSVKLRITRGPDTGTVRAVVREGWDGASLPLDLVFADEEAWRRAGAPRLIVKKPPRQVKDYISDLAVIRNGRQVERKLVEVNHPLHYGGYHFYQSDYDEQHGQYTVLKAQSDSGLYVVYAGFALLCAGAAWRFWFAPMMGATKNRAGRWR